jgi:hypothetical protein
MRARRLVVAALVLACAMVIGGRAEASDFGPYHRVTVDEVQCRDCGGPVPVGISLLVPANWKVHQADGALTATDAQNPDRLVMVTPAFVWRSGLPSPKDVRAYLKGRRRCGLRERPCEADHRRAGRPWNRPVRCSREMRSVTYLLEGQSFPVVAVSFPDRTSRTRSSTRQQQR